MYKSSAFAAIPLLLFAISAKAEESNGKNLQALPAVTCTVMDGTTPDSPNKPILEATELAESEAISDDKSVVTHSLNSASETNTASRGNSKKNKNKKPILTSFDLSEQPAKVNLLDNKHTVFAYFYVGLVRISLVEKSSRKDLKVATAPIENFSDLHMNLLQPKVHVACVRSTKTN